MGDDPDLDLVLRAGRGDDAAVQALVARKLPRMLTLAARVLGDRSEAEDVAQETMLRLWRQAPRWRSGEGRVDAWVHRVALNLCRDRLRRRRETPIDTPPDRPDPSPGAEAVLTQAERHGRVRAALAALPERQREAVALTTWQGMGNIEAAAAMGVSVEAVESLVGRARRTLRAALADVREG